MDTRAKAIIAVLIAAVVGLGATVGVLAATRDGGDGAGMGMMGSSPAGNDYMGMMRAMGGMDSGAMLQNMRGVLGDQAYQQMLDHFQQHRAGGPMTGNAGIDAMMHGMMDGMLQQMPMDRGNMMPGPGMMTPSASPTPAR